MGEHKHNPTAIAAKRGELPPKKKPMSNRCSGSFSIESNRTLTDDEMAMLNARRSGDKNYGVGNWC